MAVLGNSKLIRLTELKDLIVGGVENIRQVGPASIDLRLGNSFSRILNPMDYSDPIELGDTVMYEQFTASEVVMYPGDFLLATTVETVRIPNNMCAFVQGRSSIGRIGLTVQNAGFVDPGFYGEITLELVNESPFPIKLKAGYRIAQLVVMEADGVTEAYDGKYNGQSGATGSRMHLDKEAQE